MVEFDSEESKPDESLETEGSGALDALSMGEELTDLDKIMDKAFDEKNIEHLTELTGDEIVGFSTLGVIAAKRMPNGVIHKWLVKNLKMRVSRNRKGKGEFVKIVSRNPEQFPPQQGNRSPWGFLRGG